MATSYDDDLDLDTPRDREISLGATTIMGIFLALTLVCALFFGLGFSMGRRSALSAAAAGTPAPFTESAASTTNAPKPSPGTSTTAVSMPVEPTPTHTTSTTPPPAAVTPVGTQERPAVAKPVVAAAPQGSGGFLVQIAAVSHREDADSLLGALEQRGYQVYIRQEPQDKFLHVQIGPFTNRKEAEAMRQHLLSDGYNAIVK